MSSRSSLKSALFRLFAALALFALSACGGKAATPASSAPARPSSPAKLAIVEPAAGATVTGPTLHVKLSLEGAKIIPAATTKLKADEGHVHLSLDGSLVSMAYGLEQDIEVKPGSHLLQAEFVAGDHFPFNPRIITVKSITVQ